MARTTLPKSCDSIEAVEIPVPAAIRKADLRAPKAAQGLVIFAHGSGSSRFSARNRQVAAFLGERGFATLLLDLLTAREERIDAGTGSTASTFHASVLA